jgi:hypothetical protein
MSLTPVQVERIGILLELLGGILMLGSQVRYIRLLEQGITSLIERMRGVYAPSAEAIDKLAAETPRVPYSSTAQEHRDMVRGFTGIGIAFDWALSIFAALAAAVCVGVLAYVYWFFRHGHGLSANAAILLLVIIATILAVIGLLVCGRRLMPVIAAGSVVLLQRLLGTEGAYVMAVGLLLLVFGLALQFTATFF